MAGREKTEGISKSKRLQKVEALSQRERLNYWVNEFNKCINVMDAEMSAHVFL